MYNGLPWPDEEFARVTVERDLQICNTLKDHPILWKILWGLAEARPALCYCSVLLRAALAVQVNTNLKRFSKTNKPENISYFFFYLCIWLSIKIKETMFLKTSARKESLLIIFCSFHYILMYST
jgi:hypothetical protein